MKILLTGKNGQVGFELQRALAPLGDVVAVQRADCDLSDEEGIRALVRRVKPDIIVNAAAYTAVDKAETERTIAVAINAAAPAILGEEASRLDALTIHYSSDYVFDGRKQGPYTESDPTNPLNVYGQSKRDGEEALISANSRHVILRTSWIIGAHGANFAKTILRLAAERDRLSVVADQFGAPTPAALIADITAQLIGRYRREGDAAFPYGVYHAVSGGETSWCDYARFIVGEALTAGKALKVHPDQVQPIASAEYPTPARRPANSRLDTKRLRDTFGLRLPAWQDGVLHTLQQMF